MPWPSLCQPAPMPAPLLLVPPSPYSAPFLTNIHISLHPILTLAGQRKSLFPSRCMVVCEAPELSQVPQAGTSTGYAPRLGAGWAGTQCGNLLQKQDWKLVTRAGLQDQSWAGNKCELMLISRGLDKILEIPTSPGWDYPRAQDSVEWKVVVRWLQVWMEEWSGQGC